MLVCSVSGDYGARVPFLPEGMEHQCYGDWGATPIAPAHRLASGPAVSVGNSIMLPTPIRGRLPFHATIKPLNAVRIYICHRDQNLLLLEHTLGFRCEGRDAPRQQGLSRVEYRCIVEYEPEHNRGLKYRVASRGRPPASGLELRESRHAQAKAEVFQVD